MEVPFMIRKRISAVRFWVPTLSLALFLALSLPVGAQSPNPGDQLSEAFRAAIAKVKPAVVSISAEKKSKPVKMPGIENIPEMFKQFFPEGFFDQQIDPQRDWQGSGAIISPEGHVLTNYHVVKDADKLTVTLDDGREIEADLNQILTDPGSDIALIKLKEDGTYPYAVLGDSDAMQIGDWVLAIGSPFGLSQSVSQGIISAKGRTSSDVPVGGRDFYVKDYIQTTAAINPGNSGGPLINLRGEIIGINNAIQTAGIPGNLGIGFAIPSNLAKSVIDSLKQYGKVKRAYIGVMLENLDSSNLSQWYKQEYGINHGALVTEVIPGTPAEQAGIEKGDLIILFNGEKVLNNGHLINMVTARPIGESVELTILRKGKKMTKSLVLAERPEEDPLAMIRTDAEKLLGVTVTALNPELAKEKGYDEKLKGILVTRVIPGSSAQRVDIQINDVITEINDNPVSSRDQFEKALADIVKEMKEKKLTERVILLHVYRADRRYPDKWVAPTITLEPEESQPSSPRQ